MYPADLKYTKDHEWIRVSGVQGRIGITDYAQKQLGDVVYVELPDVGRTVSQGEALGTIESVKAVSEIFAPVSGEVVEVNAAPGLRMHLHPTTGTPRDVAEPIVRMLYPEGQPARIPIIAVTGTNGKTTVVRLVAHVFETAHACVGMTTTDGVYIGKERVMEGDCAGPRSARRPMRSTACATTASTAALSPKNSPATGPAWPWST